nr:MFS transporter [Streptococcus gallolyticus]
METGKRVEAVFSAVQSFSQKIGIGLASAIIGFVMGISGFDGNLATQSANAKLSIVGLYAYLPVVLFVLIFILLRIYPLDKQMNQVRKDLEERRSNNKI